MAVDGGEATETAVEAFAQAVANGQSQSDAYKASHSRTCKTLNRGVLANKGSAFARRPDVQRRIAEIRAETAAKNAAFRDELIGYLTDEIRECWRDNRTTGPVLRQIEIASRIMGWEKQTLEIHARTAADDATVSERLNFLARSAAEK